MKLLKSTLAALAVGSVLALSSACANAKTVLRLGYETPRTDSQHLAAKEFKKMVEEQSKGELEVKLFPDSALGNSNALINGVRNGTVDMIICGTNAFAGLNPHLKVLDLPFFFNTFEQAYKVLDGEVGQSLLDEMSKFDIKGLAFWENGYRSMSNNKHPITKPEDVVGLKIRVPNAPMQVAIFDALKANPVPMAVGELYTALETHAVDGQDHPLGVFYSVKLYEVQKYLTLTNHEYASLLMCMNQDKFNSLSADLQKVLVDSAREGAKVQRKINAEKVAKLLETFKKAGVEIVDKIDPAPFKEAIFDKVSKLYTDENGDEYIKRIEAVLK